MDNMDFNRLAGEETYLIAGLCSARAFRESCGLGDTIFPDSQACFDPKAVTKVWILPELVMYEVLAVVTNFTGLSY